METLYRKVAVIEPSQFEHNKHYYFVDFDGNIQRDCFFDYASFDEYTHRYKYFLVEIPDKPNRNTGSFLKPDQKEYADKVFEFLSKKTVAEITKDCECDKLQSDKAELLEALEKTKNEMIQCLKFLRAEGYEHMEFENLSEVIYTIQKMKQ